LFAFLSKSRTITQVIDSLESCLPDKVFAHHNLRLSIKSKGLIRHYQPLAQFGVKLVSKIWCQLGVK